MQQGQNKLGYEMTSEIHVDLHCGANHGKGETIQEETWDAGSEYNRLNNDAMH